MLGVSVSKFDDPLAYENSSPVAELKVFVTARGEFQGERTRIDLDHLCVQRGRLSLPSVVHTKLRERKNLIFFHAGRPNGPMLVDGIEAFADEMLVYCAEAEHYHRTPADHRWGLVSAAPEDLVAFGQALVGRDISAPDATCATRPEPELMRRFLSVHRAVSNLAATAPAALQHPEVARAVEEELARALVFCLTESAPERSRSSHQRLPIMKRLERMLEENQDRPLFVTEVCKTIGVTDRTLRLHCQEHLGMSPRRYLWFRRMRLARRALAAAEDARGRTVTQIANDYGFAELGRFAVEYRKLFGESPSVTLRRPASDRARSRLSCGELINLAP